MGKLVLFVQRVFLAMIICSLSLLLFQTSSQAADEFPEFKIMTETWFPYQFEKDDQAHGISVDILVFMLEKLGSKQKREDIVFYPWARGYQTTLQHKNTLLFSTTRTREREKLFKWVGPLFKNTTCLIARKDRKITINSSDDFRRFFFGTVRNDVGEQLLMREGVDPSQITRNTSSFNVIKMLQVGRLDFIAQSFIGFSSEALSIGLNPDDFECVYELNTDDICYAFHKETPDAVIEQFQKAFAELKKEGKIQEIFQKYKDNLAPKLKGVLQ